MTVGDHLALRETK